MTSSTARALKALSLVQSMPGTTASELGDRLGVSERAARRYVGILREAGIAVESIRGRYGGYRLGRGVRLPPVSFTESEALGLVMATLEATRAGTDDLLTSALNKVIRALPEVIRSQASRLQELAAASPDAYAIRPDPAILNDLVAAVAAKRQVRLAYRNASGKAWDTVVDPWAVVTRYGMWYLLCHAHHVDAIRTYRVDRIAGITELSTPSQVPADLNPVTALEEHLGTGWDYPTRVVFDAPIGEVARWVRPPMGRLEVLGEGCVLNGTTSNPAMYAGEWLASAPFDFRIEGGPELLDAAQRVARRMSTAVGLLGRSP